MLLTNIVIGSKALPLNVWRILSKQSKRVLKRFLKDNTCGNHPRSIWKHNSKSMWTKVSQECLFHWIVFNKCSSLTKITKNQSYYKQLLIKPYGYGMFILVFLETITTCMWLIVVNFWQGLGKNIVVIVI
jgi:hypothetical protein